MPKARYFGKTSRIVGLCSVANFINAADRVIMPIAIVPMTDKYHWSLQLQGWILSSFAFGYLTSQVVEEYIALGNSTYDSLRYYQICSVTDRGSLRCPKIRWEICDVLCCVFMVALYGNNSYIFSFSSSSGYLPNHAGSWRRLRWTIFTCFIFHIHCVRISYLILCRIAHNISYIC